ncbi:uncharacterized protein F5147DRAFT_726013 [Suillus discolor]|uniref:Ankyrin repeat protein n=1 Tax=Suillus discolor TaxID=1912936 RepID=A0A9P7ET01_9AGAM|nr:uncharacterized protein F5147DRAFT_726013 [Suillus discolor]KAG2089327.1 hypothetical protein F5147DRAFT_726013 [Suillus discolor]
MATESSPQVPDHVAAPTQSNTNTLPAGTVEFAHRMFDAARGDIQSSFKQLTRACQSTLWQMRKLQRKADPNRLNDLGQSMIAGAVFKSHDEVVRVLVEDDADPRIGKPTAIEAAHIFGRKELIEVLGAKQGDIGTDVPTPLSARPEN